MTKKDDIFFELAIKSNSLLLGDFTLKSGKKSPYFFNIGSFFSEGYISHLASLYADAIIDNSLSFDLLFGPAYKGIPLVAAISTSLSVKLSKPIPFAFDRKEEKTHGEGGNIVGDLEDKKVLVIDDVLTAGTALKQSIEMITNAGGYVTSGLVALDREEKIEGMLARDVIKKEYELEILSLAKISQLIDFFGDSGKDNEASIIKEYLVNQ
tara:strand:- start:557 stop:1186 length:630 start_codon:yes stop_codon:yes gene_type:complete